MILFLHQKLTNLLTQMKTNKYTTLSILVVSFIIIYSSTYFLCAETIVVIDPGHGGIFNGCQGKQTQIYEKDITLSIALKLKDILTSHNIRVILTREADIHLDEDLISDLLKRVTIAHKHAAEIFISLHCNSNPSNTAKGYELFVPMHTEFPKKSYQLAAYIHHQMSQKLDPVFSGTLGNLNTYDLGIRAAKFNVLMHVKCPATLIEIDYLTSSESEKKLITPEFQEKVATIIAQGIVNYLKNK